MARRPLPLMIDHLPLYATDAVLMGAIFGERAGSVSARSVWESLTRSPNFPRLSPRATFMAHAEAQAPVSEVGNGRR
jgi:hypothetical protein